MMAKLYAETCKSNDRLQYCVYKKLTKTEFILKKYQDWYDDDDDDDDDGGGSGCNGGGDDGGDGDFEDNNRNLSCIKI